MGKRRHNNSNDDSNPQSDVHQRPWEDRGQEKPNFNQAIDPRVAELKASGVRCQTVTLTRTDVTYFGKQIDHRQDIFKSTLNITSGVAGTGKTHTALSVGLELILSPKSPISTLHYVRMEQRADGAANPAVGGNAHQKFERFIKVLKDPLQKILGEDVASRILASITLNGFAKYKDVIISAGPTGDERGMTHNGTYTVFDEASGASEQTLELEIGRTGTNSKLVILGDPRQNDVRVKENLSVKIAELAMIMADPLVTNLSEAERLKLNQKIAAYIEKNSPPQITPFQRIFANAANANNPAISTTEYGVKDIVRNSAMGSIFRDLFPQTYG